MKKKFVFIKNYKRVLYSIKIIVTVQLTPKITHL